MRGVLQPVLDERGAQTLLAGQDRSEDPDLPPASRPTLDMYWSLELLYTAMVM